MAQSLGTPILDLQQMLRVIYPDNTLNLDGVYGKETEAEVRRFQNEHGLPATGVVDLATWDAIRAAYFYELVHLEEAEPLRIVLQPHQVLAAGTDNVHMLLVQALLKSLGRYYQNMPGLRVTGLHDPQSVQAIRWFQTQAGLPVSGDVDKHTWQRLAKQYRLTVGDGTGQFPVRQVK